MNTDICIDDEKRPLEVIVSLLTICLLAMIASKVGGKAVECGYEDCIAVYIDKGKEFLDFLETADLDKEFPELKKEGPLLNSMKEQTSFWRGFVGEDNGLTLEINVP